MSQENKQTIILAKDKVMQGPNLNILVVGSAGTGKTYTYVLPNLLQCNGSYVVVDLGGVLREATEKTFQDKGYQIKTLRIRAMSLADAEQIDLSMLSFQPTVVYIIPSFDRNLNDAVIRLLIDKVLENTHENGLSVHLFLDEFVNLGYIPSFYSLFATKKISYSIIIQSIDQLAMLYKESCMTIVDNCEAIVYMGSCDYRTADFIKTQLGKETVSINGAVLERDILTLEEIRGMDSDKCLVITKGQTPSAIIAQKYNPIEHPNYHIEPQQKT